MTTVLDAAVPVQAKTIPYSYIVVEDALPESFYAELSKTFPSLDKVPAAHAKANNKRLDLLSSWGKTILPANLTPPIWSDFMKEHTAPEFTARVFDLFPSVTEPAGEGDARIIKTSVFGDTLAEKLGLSGPILETDIVRRVTLGVNTPVKEKVSVRGPHVDSPRKAYVGLFYLRHADDHSEGGDLSIYRWKRGAMAEPWAGAADPDAVEEVAVVKYRPNTLVLMLNTQDSLHGVTPREPTPFTRRLAIISGWFPGVDKTNFVRGDLARSSGPMGS